MHTIFPCRNDVPSRARTNLLVLEKAKVAGAVGLLGTIMTGKHRVRRLGRGKCLGRKPYMLTRTPLSRVQPTNLLVNLLVTTLILFNKGATYSETITKIVVSRCLLCFATELRQQVCSDGAILEVLTRTTLLMALPFILVSWMPPKIIRSRVTFEDYGTSPSLCYDDRLEVYNTTHKLRKLDQSFKMENSSERGEKWKRVAGDLNPTLREDDAPNSLPARGEERRRKRPLGIELCVECGTDPSCEWRKGPAGAKPRCNACGLRCSKEGRWLQSQNNNPTVLRAAGPSPVPSISDSSYSMPPPSTPKKSFVSLTKLLLTSKDKLRVHAEARVMEHRTCRKISVELQIASNAPILELGNTHSCLEGSTSILRENATEVAFNNIVFPVKSQTLDLPISVQMSRPVQQYSRVLRTTRTGSSTPFDAAAPFHVRDLMTRLPSESTFFHSGRSPLVFKSFGKNPGFPIGEQRGNAISPTEGDDSSAPNHNGAESSRGSFTDSYQASGQRNRRRAQKSSIWSKLLGAKEPSSDALNQLREKTFTEAKVSFDDPDAAVKLKVSSRKLPPEAPRPDSKETESLRKLWPPHKPRPPPPTFENQGQVRVTSANDYGLESTNGT